MADKIRISDENFAYDQTSSEDDYSDEEKELLQEYQKSQRKEKPNIKDVLAFTESEESEESEDIDNEDEGENVMDVADSDIEGANDSGNDEADTRYWGKVKQNYYNTDFVDQDYSSYNEKEEELAKMEEEEAQNIRLRLAKELKEEDFLLDNTLTQLGAHTTTDTKQDETLSSTHLKSDFTKLTKRERLHLFEKDAPEFAGLVGDLEGYLEEIDKLHNPVLEYCHLNDVLLIPALRFAQLYQNIALTYCNNVMFYLLLKSKRQSVQYHPVIKRLGQLKKLLNQLNGKHENIIKPQLEALLTRIEDGDDIKVLPMKSIISPPRKAKKQNCKEAESPKKQQDHEMQSSAGEGDDNDAGNDMKSKDDAEEGATRRGITYEIAKNKGLIPNRKKEQRNPRVKHRGKYRKALIRRKGAVRTIRKESKRYGGEISGIKATVSKSIKFKT